MADNKSDSEVLKMRKQMIQRYILWLMMAVQMVAWLWLQSHGGELEGFLYIWFCAGMMVGQIGASLECVMTKAWGTLIVQLYFFIFIGYGAIVRYLQVSS
jgi:hypothetical protein